MKTKVKFDAKTKEDALVWWLGADPNSVKYPEPYTKADAMAREGGGLIHSGGYYPETNQSILTIQVTPDTDVDYVVGLVELVLPQVKTQEESGKVFHIFEDTLSEFRTYELRFTNDGVWQLGGYQHYSRLIDRNFDSLNDAIEYIKTHHPYGAKRTSGEDSD